MKVSAGVVGYGNLGASVAKLLKESEEFELKAIFSKRDFPFAEKYSRILDYEGKIDLLFVCGGSQNELENQTRFLIKHFNLIESYDNHARLKGHIDELGALAVKHEKIALCSFGWDPGLFSLMRGLFDSLGYAPYSFWGKGLSQGHTQAIKNISGVKDALQFTVPNVQIIDAIKRGEEKEVSKNFHKRVCYVVCEKSEQKRIENEIKNMPDYFLGYETSVNFVSQSVLDGLKSFAHKGEVITQSNVLNFSLNLKSNPDFTARVMTTFARAYAKLKQDKIYGAFDIFDLPLSAILTKNPHEYL